jgi:hypothetical protein
LERISYPLLSRRDFIPMVSTQKEIVDELKVEWKKLWNERVEDKVRAEGIAVDDYSSIFIDKGTIIHATRDFKALDFKDILEKQGVINVERYVHPNPHVGGWGRFVRDNITNQTSKKRNSVFVEERLKGNIKERMHEVG